MFLRGESTHPLLFSKQYSKSDRSSLVKSVWRLARLSLIAPAMALGIFFVGHYPVTAQVLSAGITALQFGDRGPQVTTLQEALSRAGFPVSADGVYGSATENAVRQFQLSRGIIADGVYGFETEAALFGSSPNIGSPPPTTPSTPPRSFAAGSRTIRVGDRGSDVTELQRLLNNRGFNAGAEDGTFGSATTSAVQSFQLSQGLVADGIVGRDTWRALGVSTTPDQPPSDGEMTPLATILEQGRYVVVVPGNDRSKLTTIQSELGRQAYLTRSGRGSFVTPGGYSSYRAARNDALRLRGANLDARVEFFN